MQHPTRRETTGFFGLRWLLLLAVGLPLAGCASRGGLLDPGTATDDGGVATDDGGARADGPGGAGDGGAGHEKDLGPDGGPQSNDPFDPASCNAPPLTAAQGLARLGAAARLKLADATLYRRSRSCTGMTADTCGPFAAPVVHTQSLLTYSGGVVTDYKTFSFPTHLILFPQGGQPKFTIRHESDYRKNASADTRGVVFAFGANPMVNSYPIIYVWDFAPAPNRYDDLQGLLGKTGELHAAERCARVVFRNGISTEIAALYRY